MQRLRALYCIEDDEARPLLVKNCINKFFDARKWAVNPAERNTSFLRFQYTAGEVGRRQFRQATFVRANNGLFLPKTRQRSACKHKSTRTLACKLAEPLPVLPPERCGKRGMRLIEKHDRSGQRMKLARDFAGSFDANVSKNCHCRCDHYRCTPDRCDVASIDVLEISTVMKFDDHIPRTLALERQSLSKAVDRLGDYVCVRRNEEQTVGRGFLQCDAQQIGGDAVSCRGRLGPRMPPAVQLLAM